MGNLSRKLIKWGSSNTLIISLPRKWIKENQLSADQNIKIQMNPDGTLTLIPQEFNQELKEEVATIKIKDAHDFFNIRLLILTKFLDGTDVIKLETQQKAEFPSNIKKMIEDIIDPLMGLEIFGANRNSVVIKNVIKIDSSNVFSLIKMISDNTIELGQILLKNINSSIENYKSNDPSLMSDTDNGSLIWENIEKYYFRTNREFRRNVIHPLKLIEMKMNMQDILDITQYLFSVYSIAKSINTLISIVRKQKLPVDEFNAINFFKDVFDTMKQSLDAFLFKETVKTLKIMKKIREIKPRKREIENLVDIAENDPSGPKLIGYQILLDVSDKILDECEDICLASLRRAI